MKENDQSLGHMSISGIAESDSRFRFSFLRILHTDSQGGWTNLHPHQQWVRFLFSTASPVFVAIALLILAILDEHFLRYFLASFVSSTETSVYIPTPFVSLTSWSLFCFVVVVVCLFLDFLGFLFLSMFCIIQILALGQMYNWHKCTPILWFSPRLCFFSCTEAV